MKKLILFCIISFTVTILSAQQVTVYKTGLGHVYTRAQLDSIISTMQTRLGGDGISVTEEVIRQEQSRDTLFLYYKLNINVRQAIIEESPTEIENAKKWKELTGGPLPAFALKDIRDNIIDSKKFIGKPVVLNFWFTTCFPCIAEMPALNKIREDYKQTDVVFLSMTYESREQVIEFLKKRRFDFPVIANARPYLEQFTSSYPVSVFISREGIIKTITYGMPIIGNNSGLPLTDQPVDPTPFLGHLKEIL